MFTLLCCADLYGAKVNLEITWDQPLRSFPDLEHRITEVFSQEMSRYERRPGTGNVSTSHNFRIARIQVYDDDRMSWTDLTHLSQLHEFDQLYVFQPQTRWHRDTQQDLPPPRPPSFSRPSVAVAAQPFRSHDAADVVEADHRIGWRGATAEAAEAGFVPAGAAVGPSSSPSLSWNGMQSKPRGVSPELAARLEEHRRQEETLLDRLRRLRQERDALERQAALEEEQALRRQAEEADRMLRDKEDRIWQQREALRRAEHEFQSLLQRKQQLVRHTYLDQ